jgi:hypothetical protein
VGRDEACVQLVVAGKPTPVMNITTTPYKATDAALQAIAEDVHGR